MKTIKELRAETLQAHKARVAAPPEPVPSMTAKVIHFDPLHHAIRRSLPINAIQRELGRKAWLPPTPPTRWQRIRRRATSRTVVNALAFLFGFGLAVVVAAVWGTVP